MLNRNQAPPFSQQFAWALPRFRRIPCNGYDIVVNPHLGQPVVKIEIIFLSGKWFETTPGTAYFTAQMLEKGTPRHTALQISEYLESRGIFLETENGPDFTSLSLYALEKQCADALSMLAEILQTPSFPKDELKLLKHLYIQHQRVRIQKKTFLASRLIKRMIFGHAHPYGYASDERDIEAIKQSHLREYFPAFYKPCAAYVTGNITTEHISQIQAILDGMGKLKNGTAAHEVHTAKAYRYHVEKNNSSQSAIYLAKQTIRNTDPDYPVLCLINHILGGYFGSRLMKNIREEKGLTYGISSHISHFRHSAMISISAEVNKSHTDEVLSEINREIETLASEKISEKELQTAKNHLLGAMQMELANPFSVTDKVKIQDLYGLSNNYFSTLVAGIQKTTQEEICAQSAAKLGKTPWHTVTVG